MLAGVGGRTIEEAKRRLSYPEALSWFAYRAKHGPLSVLKRLEWALAQVAYVVASSSGSKKKGGGTFSIADFLPQFSELEPEREASLEDLQSMFGGKRK